MRWRCDICGGEYVGHEERTRCFMCQHSEAGWRKRIEEEQAE